MPSPIGGVHIYDHIFVLWNHMYVAHAFEPFPNSPHAEGILLWKLPQCQFAVNVVGYYWFTIRPVTSDELPSAVKTLIKLTASPSAILFDARRPAPFALFLFIKWYFQHRKVIGIQITASISAYFFAISPNIKKELNLNDLALSLCCLGRTTFLMLHETSIL